MPDVRKPWMRRIRIILAALTLAVAGAAFSGAGGAAALLLHVQYAPAWMRSFAACSAGALATLAGLTLLALLVGRAYCAVLCPFGVAQDLVAFFARRRKGAAYDFAVLRYAVAGVVFALFFAGWTGGFLLLDPYSGFGRLFGPVTAGSVAVLAVLLACSLWTKRLYCNALCPVGTVLGLLSKAAFFRLIVTEACVQCGQCVKHCPAGCIDPAARTLDNERCLRCMNCMAVCPRGAVRFRFAPAAAGRIDRSRRDFLKRGGALLAGAAAGAVLAGTGLRRFVAAMKKHLAVLPPGAGSAERFAARCTACQLCTVNCPAKIIVPAPGGDGPVALDLEKGFCRFDCARCSQVCPTGALRPLSLAAKQRTRIAEGRFNPANCIVFQADESCGRCAAACPTGAIKLRKNGTPRPVDPKLCIGCGACQAACPALPKAMTVHPVEQQSQLEE